MKGLHFWTFKFDDGAFIDTRDLSKTEANFVLMTVIYHTAVHLKEERYKLCNSYQIQVITFALKLFKNLIFSRRHKI